MKWIMHPIWISSLSAFNCKSMCKMVGNGKPIAWKMIKNDVSIILWFGHYYILDDNGPFLQAQRESNLQQA